ncbi:MAG: polyphosphate kinase 1 [Gemmatimonadetes bacterium]|nr:polyphosphate kinase 1 [Gemmatimonadota bacterium]
MLDRAELAELLLRVSDPVAAVPEIEARARTDMRPYLASQQSAVLRGIPWGGVEMSDESGKSKYIYVDRETSWLQFGHRVLQEASDPSVPLLERLFFCGIFSSNLDEYFRVRVASLRSLLRLGKTDVARLGISPHRLLHDIHQIVLQQQEQYGSIIGDIFAELKTAGFARVDEGSVAAAHHDFLAELFAEQVRPLVEPFMLQGEDGPPFLDNNQVYLVIELFEKGREVLESWTPEYALLKVPSDSLPRFITLPARGDTHEVMFLDDLIRYNLDQIFPKYEVGRSYAVKLTRDAELHVEDEFEGDLVEAIRKSLKNRDRGVPSRFLYDMRTPYVLIHRLQHGLGLQEEDLVLGARYHNLKDYLGFPRFGRKDLSYPDWPTLPHPVFDGVDSVMAAVRDRDQVVHTPYQSFDHFVRFLDEAAEDPDVEELWLTVYRVARDSDVLTALIRAAHAGKNVTVFMEVQARFDEESNLHWADQLEAAGVRTLYSMQGLKVHAKIALVATRDGDERSLYAYVGTGNFNEKTAGVYADHGVYTCDERITKDVEQVFRFLAGEIEEPTTEHLLTAPLTLRKGFYELIEREAQAAREGKPSGMTLKMNALEDKKIIKRLYDASVAGVPIEIIVRGICRLVPGVPGQSDTIRVRSILDRHLEHARIYAFHNGGDEIIYLASADWMKRNLSRRVEVALPVYDPEIKRQLRRLLDLELADNTKARWIDASGANVYVQADGKPRVRSQEAFRDFLAELAPGP